MAEPLILKIIQRVLDMLGQSQKAQMQNEERFYLRFHNAISRAIDLNKEIFGDKLGKDGIQPRFQHPLRVAGMCEQILDQTIEQYHMGWLIGILHDDKEHNPLIYGEKIGFVLEDLLPDQKKKVTKYIEDLSSDKSLSKGQQKRDQLLRVQKMDLIPSWILIFDKYDNCVRFKQNPVGKDKDELDGYYSVAYLIYLTARNRHNPIKEFMISETKRFFEKMGEQLGGQKGAREHSERYFKQYDK